MTTKTRPGLLAELAGVTIEEVRPYHHGQQNEIAFRSQHLADRKCAVGTWVEVLQCGTAEAIAEFTDEALASKPAITCNTCGQGKVYYLGVLLPDAVLKDLMGEILPDFPIKDIPEGVEITQRKGPQKRVVFIINHAPERRTLTLPGQFLELLSGQTIGPQLTIARHGVLVLKA